MRIVLDDAKKVILSILETMNRKDISFNATYTKDDKLIMSIPESDTNSNPQKMTHEQFRIMAQNDFKYDLGDIIAIQVFRENDRSKLIELASNFISILSPDDFSKLSPDIKEIQMKDISADEIKNILFKINKVRHHNFEESVSSLKSK